MDKIVVKNQAELDAIPLDYSGLIIIEYGTRWDPAIVSRSFFRPVVAWENSSVEAWENSSVEARENSSVEARQNSSVVAWGNSSVVAWENSSVEARQNSSVVAWGNSSVEARENSSVEAWGNSQVVDRQRGGFITTNGNSRLVTDPTTIDEYIASVGAVYHDKTTVRLYKAVHKIGKEYFSNADKSFKYQIGESAVADAFTTDPYEDCGHGIHMAHKSWCVDFGRSWEDLAILEVEAKKNEIVVPRSGCGTVRAPSVKVIREVPLEECGLIGKMYLKRHSNE